MVLRKCKRRRTNLAMAWIDYRKAYDMVPHSWILEALQLMSITPNIHRLVRESMEKWKTTLTSTGADLCEVRNRRRN